MIISESFGKRKDGVKLVRRYSDKGVMIKKVGTDELYSDAIDLEGSAYEYQETEFIIEKNQEGEKYD